MVLRERKNMGKSKKNTFVEFLKQLIIAIIPALVSIIGAGYYEKNQINKAIAARFDFVDSTMSYEESLECISKELETSKKEVHSLNKELDEQTSLIDKQNSADEINTIIQNATQYWNTSDYQQCLSLLKNSKSSSTDIESLYSKYSDEYVSILLSEADSLISLRKYEDALNLLKDNKQLVNNNKKILDRINEINVNKPTKLSDIKITSSRFWTQNDDKPLMDTVGNKYSTGNSFVTYAEGESNFGYGTFYMGKKYTSLVGIIAVSDDSEDRSDTQLQGWIEIGIKSNDNDFNSLWSSPMFSRTTSQIEIPELNIEDSEWIEIRYYNDGEYYSLAEGYHSLKIIVSDVTLYVD